MPWSITQDSHQAEYIHAAVMHEKTVVAYGQLVPRDDREAYPESNRIYQVCQMVVRPKYQGQNFGKKILAFLITQAKKDRAIALTLNARLTAVGFYQNLGFKTHGTPFPSSTTGVMHIAMNRNL